MAIAIEINPGREYELLEEGVVSAVLADVVDLGIVDTQFGPKPKIRLVWLTSQSDSKGQTKRAFQTFTRSVNEKASLTKALKQMGVKLPTSGSFDVESLIGTNAQLVIQHSENATGKTYANVASILKPTGQKLTVPRDFVRKAAQTNNNPKPIGDDDIPF